MKYIVAFTIRDGRHLVDRFDVFENKEEAYLFYRSMLNVEHCVMVSLCKVVKEGGRC